MIESPAPVCSVCIANYNGMRFIDACIRSVQGQDCGFAVEIIVHDDASTDGSADYIRATYPEVVLIRSEQNVGFCVSNNRMVNAARGEYILLLNNDATLFPDALRTLHDAAKGFKEGAILGLPQFDASTMELIDIGSRLDLFLNPVPHRDSAQSELGMIIGACFWLPRTLWDKLGGFPEWFGSLAEDMLLCCLARLYGYRVEALTASGFTHWVGQSLGGGKLTGNRLSSKATRRAMSERNKNFVMALTYPAPYLQILLPIHILLLLSEGAIMAILKRDSRIFLDIYLGSIIALWARRRQLSILRREIQRQRKCGRAAFFSAFQWMPHKLSLLLKHGIPEINR